MKLALEKSDGKVENIEVGSVSDNAQYCRLSEAPLWGMMQRLFDEGGVGLWSEENIPSNASSNSFIAHSKSRLVATFLQEQAAKGKATEKTPNYILELGAGSGRFAYHFLQHFFGPDGKDPLVENTVYIMSDVAKANIQFWREHEQFQPFIEAGVLEFSKFDAMQDKTLTLEVSGATISKNSVKTPLVAIANYVIDSIPVDLFAVSGGVLYEKLCSVRQAADPNESFRGAKFFYRTKEVVSEYYGDPQWMVTLQRYMGHTGTFQFSLPIGGFSIIDTMRLFASGASMLLVSDYGILNMAAIKRTQLVNIDNNGNSTVAVNFDALRGYTENLGGCVMQFDGAYSSIASCGYIFDGSKSPRAAKRYNDHFSAFGPDDYDALHTKWAERKKSPDLREAIYLVRLSKYEVTMFLQCRKALIIGARRAGGKNLPLLKETLLSIANKVWQHYYFIHPKHDPALELSQMYLPLGEVDKALEVLEMSCRFHGETANKQIMLERCMQVKAEQAS